jgi:hypothetical protein
MDDQRERKKIKTKMKWNRSKMRRMVRKVRKRGGR